MHSRDVVVDIADEVVYFIGCDSDNVFGTQTSTEDPPHMPDDGDDIATHYFIPDGEVPKQHIQ